MTNQPSEPLPCEVILLTALPVEFQAVMRHVQDVQEVVHPSGTIYHRGTFAGAQQTWCIAVAEIGMGGTATTAEAEKAIQFFHPHVALFVGVAGGLKDVQRGDVVVATKVYAYEAGKAGQRFEPRPSLGHFSHALEQRARAEAHRKEWLARLEGDSPAPAPQVFLGPIAAGEKVLSSKQSSIARLLKRTYSDALAIEMEGHGFLHAVRINHAIHGLVIRGISDLVDDKAVADASGMQTVAARHAAAFAFQVLAKFTLPSSDRRPERKSPVMLPPHAQSFVGREEEVDWLLQQFAGDTGKTIGLCGPGGMGKTALAAEALKRFTDQRIWSARFPGGVFYHSFYTFPSIATAFEEIARFLGEEPDVDPHRAALRALSRHRTLLVFDGVEELADTRSLRKLGGGHVVLLLSRRRSDVPDLAYRRDLGELSREQSITLLQCLAGPRASDRASAERLVQQVGGYPLAIQLIGSYLSSQQEEVGDYLQWFEREGLAAIHFGEHQDQSASVLLQRTYDTLTKIEQEVFVLLGLLAPAPFPLELAQRILQVPGQTMRQALGSLVNMSVLRRPNHHYEVSHPLVHTFAKERLSSPTDAPSDITIVWMERLLNTLLTSVEQNNPYDRAALTLWSPHVLLLLSTLDWAASQCLSVARLFDTVGFDAYTQGKYTEAEPLLQRALAIREQELGAHHSSTAQSLNNLAALSHDRGDYAQAETLYQQALEIRQHILGNDHPDTATCLNNLARLYHDRGDYEQAAMLYQQALEIRQRILGNDHPDTAATLNHLAKLYYYLGMYGEAEPIFRQSLDIRQRIRGNDHPDTATSLNNLARLYYRRKKYEQAEQLLLEALDIRQRILREDHRETAISLNNLAELYHDQENYEQAETLYQQALNIRQRILGKHTETATTLNNLARLYRDRKEFERAEPFFQQALTMRQQVLGEHCDTATCLNDLAELYDIQGKFEQAESLYWQALLIREQVLGDAHPDTVNSLTNLAKLYADQERRAEAELLFARIRAMPEQIQGSGFPIAITKRSNFPSLQQIPKQDEGLE